MNEDVNSFFTSRTAWSQSGSRRRQYRSRDVDEHTRARGCTINRSWGVCVFAIAMSTTKDGNTEPIRESVADDADDAEKIEQNEADVNGSGNGDEDADGTPPTTMERLEMHKRSASASSTLEAKNYTQLNLDAKHALEAFEELGPLDGEMEFERLGSFRSAVLNILAAFRVFRRFLITAESLIVAMVSVAATLFFVFYEIHGHRLAVNLSWTFVSFAIIYPLTGSLDSAFRRREEALKQLAIFKTSVLSYYQGHRDWDWGKNGRENLPAKHVHEVRWMTVALVCDVRNFLTAPEVTRLVHLNTSRGRVAWEKGRKIQWAIARRVREHFQKLSLTTEILKYAGMPGNESSRIRQFTKEAHNAWENMRFLKTYRTPMATRAFARVYILIHPIFWGPYYAQIVSDVLHDEAGGYTGAEIYDIPSYSKGLVIFYACCMSVITSLAMLGLFNVRYSLEDPFATKERRNENGASYARRYTRGQDQVLINKELRELVNDLCLEFENIHEESGGGVPAQLYPLSQRSRLQTIEVAEELDGTTVVQRNFSGKGYPNLNRLETLMMR